MTQQNTISNILLVPKADHGYSYRNYFNWKLQISLIQASCVLTEATASCMAFKSASRNLLIRLQRR